MRLSFIVLLFLFSSNSFEQSTNYQRLLDTALNVHGCLFIHSTPTKIKNLDPISMWQYVEYLKERSNQNLDTVMFLQIIHNSATADTSIWKEEELPKSLLIKERDETVSKKYAIEKLKLTDGKQIKFYKKQINQFNSTETSDRDVCYFSRPVFDNSKTFAVLEWSNGHGGLGGGGGIILYQLQNDRAWKELGIINHWKY